MGLYTQQLYFSTVFHSSFGEPLFQYFPAATRPELFQSYGSSSDDRLLRARLWATYSSVTLIWYGHHNNKRDLVERGLLGCKNVLEK